jgi:hypothetical protein
MRALKPVVAVDAMLRDWAASQGYEVQLVRVLEDDPETSDQLLLEYSAASDDRNETVVYRWAYRSVDGTPFQSFAQLVLFSREHEFELVPVSEPASEIKDRLSLYVRNVTAGDIKRWSAEHEY